jgi:uncharacterized protein (DUF1684 family)
MARFLIGLLGIAMFASSTYTDDIRAWQQQRDKSLRSENGWLTLVGLFWLKPGDNTIGSDPSNDFVLPKGTAPLRAGTLHLEGDKVTFTDTEGKSQGLHYSEAKPDLVKIGSVSLFVIRRGDKLAIRAKDSESPVLKNFTGMKYFPINPAFRFEAKFIPDEKKIPILNILGQTELETSPGIVEFTFQGKTYQLRPIYEDKTLFFLFKDPTNHVNTYQAGRMLNTPLPENGKVDLDFNRSYNPPCTFTPYATCPLPPKENTLPFAVEAGEMRYGKGHVEYGY